MLEGEYIYIYIQIYTYYDIILYGTVRYYTLYAVWCRTVLYIYIYILIRYGTVRYYAKIRILACMVILYTIVKRAIINRL